MGGIGSGRHSGGGSSDKESTNNRIKQLKDAAKAASRAGNHQLATSLKGKAHAAKLMGKRK